MAFDVKGVSELLGDLSKMASTVGEDGSATKRTLKAGAEPIHSRMVQNASRDPKVISGKLRGAIRIGSIRKKGAGQSISIGLHKGEGAMYGVPVEFGHGGPAPAPPHPFIRPAYDAEAENAYETMKRELRAAIDRRG